MIISFEEYELACERWYIHWSYKAPCTFNEFLGLTYSPTFGSELKFGILPDPAAEKIKHLCSPHYATAIKVWVIKNEN